MILFAQIYRLTYRNITLIGSGPVVTGRMGNNGHFMGTPSEVWGAGTSSSQKRIDQDTKWNAVQMIQRTSGHGVG